MATFTISMSVEVDAQDYDHAYEIQRALFRSIQKLDSVMGGPYEIDVEQQDGFEDEPADEDDEVDDE